MIRFRRIPLLLAAPCALLAGACLTNGLDSYDAAGSTTGGGGEGGQSAHTSTGTRSTTSTHSGSPTSGTTTGSVSTAHTSTSSGGASSPASTGVMTTTSTGGQGGGGQGGNAEGGGCAGTTCGTSCVDLQTDAAHCGACGVACPAGYGCAAGVCGNVPISLSAGLNTCTVLHGGEVWCWGRDVWGEAGIDPALANATSPFLNDKCQTTPTKLPIITNAIDVQVGSEFVCALTAGGEVYCWGSNENGCLGHDPATDTSCVKAGGPNTGMAGPCSFVPKKVALPVNVTAVQLAVGSQVVCIRSNLNNVYCWGQNGDAAIKGNPSGLVPTPTINGNVTGDASDVAVSLTAEGFETVCVTRSTDSHVDCWGQVLTIFEISGSGDVGCRFNPGDGPCTGTAHAVPSDFAAGTGHVFSDKLQVGYLSACALRAGAVSCWGNDEFAQKGNGSTSGNFNPFVVAGPSSVTTFSATFATTLMIDPTGQVWGLGWNPSAQVGTGALDGVSCPGGGGSLCIARAIAVPGVADAVVVSAGSQNSGAITKSGKVMMWGSNYAGEMAHAPNTGGDIGCGTGLYCHPSPEAVVGLP